MSQTPGPPPPVLSEKHDADAIKVLDAILTRPASELKESVADAKAFFGVRIAGDLRPRVLEGIAAKAELEKLLGEQAQADELQSKLKNGMTKAGIKL